MSLERREFAKSLMNIFFIFESVRLMVELSDELMLGVFQVSIQDFGHQSQPFVLVKVADEVSSHQCNSFGSNELIEASEHHIWIGCGRISLIVT